MEPGLLAIVVLLFSALAGARFGRSLSRSHSLPNGIVILSTTAGVTALVFFAWAVANTVRGGSLDGGAVSFPLALAAALYGYGAFSGCGAAPGRWAYRTVGFFGFAAVASDYAYVLSVVGLDLGSAFELYLVFGTIYWGLLAALSTCVDVAPKSAPGAPSSAAAGGGAYSKIPSGSLRV